MLIAVDKPLELSSFDIVRRLKHEFPGEKMGHSGTLDPKATGMMILGVGKGTKKLATLIGLDKVYETVIDFSKMSDTWDLGYWDVFEEYDLIENGIEKAGKKISAPTLENIQILLNGLIPSAQLPLPAFSAKRKDGKRLYDLARKGEIVSETRDMKIYGYEIISYSFPVLKLRLNVGSGTYIRSIGYWLGQQLGLGGILTELRRLKVGDWDLREIDLDQEVDYMMHGQSGSFRWTILEE